MTSIHCKICPISGVAGVREGNRDWIYFFLRQSREIVQIFLLYSLEKINKMWWKNKEITRTQHYSTSIRSFRITRTWKKEGK